MNHSKSWRASGRPWIPSSFVKLCCLRRWGATQEAGPGLGTGVQVGRRAPTLRDSQLQRVGRLPGRESQGGQGVMCQMPSGQNSWFQKAVTETVESPSSEPGLWSRSVGSDPGLATSLSGIMGKPPLSPCPGFLICNRRAIMIPTSQVCCEDEMS